MSPPNQAPAPGETRERNVQSRDENATASSWWNWAPSPTAAAASVQRAVARVSGEQETGKHLSNVTWRQLGVKEGEAVQLVAIGDPAKLKPGVTVHFLIYESEPGSAPIAFNKATTAPPTKRMVHHVPPLTVEVEPGQATAEWTVELPPAEAGQPAAYTTYLAFTAKCNGEELSTNLVTCEDDEWLPPSPWADDLVGPPVDSEAYRQRVIEAAKLLVERKSKHVHPKTEGWKLDTEVWRTVSCWMWAWTVFCYARLTPDIFYGKEPDAHQKDYYLRCPHDLSSLPKPTRKNRCVYRGEHKPRSALPWLKNHATNPKGTDRRQPAPESYYEDIRPADWLWIYNGNGQDPEGGHSVVVLEYDKAARVVKVADQRLLNIGGQYSTWDLNENPVYAIYRSG